MTGLENTERVVRCPGCGGESVYAVSNPARPFCSLRCKNADLGAWATEDRSAWLLAPGRMTWRSTISKREMGRAGMLLLLGQPLQYRNGAWQYGFNR
jgi:endogenous inhibitor of DNA gyrase (YacG/DUF329 family)